MKILFDEHRLVFKRAEPVTFEIYSQGTGHDVTYHLENPSGSVLENRALLPENDRIEFHYDPLTHGRRKLKLNLGFSKPQGGHYRVKVLGGIDRNEIAVFQIWQRTNMPNISMLFGLEGDDDTDAPDDDEPEEKV